MRYSSTPRPRNRRGEGGRLREEIIEAASVLLDADGPEAVTLRAVARTIGIAAPSIYAHFDGPEAILAELVQAGFAQLITDLEAAKEGRSDSLDRLHAGCAAYLAFAALHSQRYNLMFRHTTGAAYRYAAPDDQGAAAFALLVDGITDCVKAGRSASADPFGDAIALWVGLHGYATLRGGHSDFPWPPEPEILSRLVNGLARIIDAPE